MRGAAIGIALITVLAAGGAVAVRFLGNGQGPDSATTLDTPTAAAQGSAGDSGKASAGMPQVASSPRVAVMPTPSGSPVAPAKRPSTQASSPSPSATASGGTAPASTTPTTTPTAALGSATCQHPQYETSDPTAMWNLAPYFVANDMWNASAYSVSQTLYACSYSDWYVVATMNNDSGDGAVKTYPNSHRDFDSNPEISSFSSITSTFAETSPGTGIYEDAYDIWLNGIASTGSTEVMIWTQNNGQSPSGSIQGTVTLDGRSYTVWKTTGNYIAFVAKSNFTSGTMNLLDFFDWIMSKGWIPTNSTLGQVDYGAELVSTNGVPATFTFSNFSVNAS